MKIRKVAALVAAVVITHSAQAQWKKGYEQNDWSVSYGFSSCITMVDALGDVEMSDPSLGNIARALVPSPLSLCIAKAAK